jgi:hypothetical protein
VKGQFIHGSSHPSPDERQQQHEPQPRRPPDGRSSFCAHFDAHCAHKAWERFY